MIHFKLKCRPEDFRVEEIASLPLLPGPGAFAVYELEKKGWNTVDCLREASRAWNLAPDSLAYGGKKDRHAWTTQWITGPPGKPPVLTAENFSLRARGFSGHPMGPQWIAGNRFSLAVRKLHVRDLRVAQEALEQVRETGFLNYFDDQRFGGLDPERGFMAEEVLKRHFNGAVKSYFTSIHGEDKKEEKIRKRKLAGHWGDWPACLREARTREERSAFALLAGRPRGFLEVLQRIPKEELSMAFSAFQSFLWNETARRRLDLFGAAALKYAGKAGEYWFYSFPGEKLWRELSRLQLPTADSKIRMPDGATQAVYDGVLSERGLHPGRFNLRELRRAFFKSTPRALAVIPGELTAEAGEDEIYPGFKVLHLRFQLPRGSYASLLVKRLFAQPR